MILITGAGGQLGQSFQMQSQPPLPLCPVSSAQLDITDAAAIASFFLQNNIRYCVNCAAYTAVDKAESEPERAKAVNVDGVRRLARACALRGIPFIHFSTDYVYHSRRNTPYKETDAVRPRGVYARTKLAGERAALKAHPSAMVIRTSWVYSPFGNNFVKTILRYGRERPVLRVVYDQIGTPTYAPDLAGAVLQIIGQLERGEKQPYELAGIWHYSNEGAISWYDFAQAVARGKGLDCRIEAIESWEFPTTTERPFYSVLHKGKIKQAFGLEIPYWLDSLEDCLRRLE
jgi:dTDP-4-dehydrorhamnose reductase